MPQGRHAGKQGWRLSRFHQPVQCEVACHIPAARDMSAQHPARTRAIARDDRLQNACMLIVGSHYPWPLCEVQTSDDADLFGDACVHAGHSWRGHFEMMQWLRAARGALKMPIAEPLKNFQPHGHP